MLTAKDPVTGKRIVATHTGQRAVCPSCSGRMDAVVGDVNAHHWRHFSGVECDTWAHPETPWHLGWKAAAALAGWGIEVVMPPHRADAQSPARDIVIEFQHSALAWADLHERTDFYSALGHMVWLFNATPAWSRQFLRWSRGASTLRCVVGIDDGVGITLLLPVTRSWLNIPRAEFFTRLPGLLLSDVRPAPPAPRFTVSGVGPPAAPPAYRDVVTEAILSAGCSRWNWARHEPLLSRHPDGRMVCRVCHPEGPVRSDLRTTAKETTTPI